MHGVRSYGRMQCINISLKLKKAYLKFRLRVFIVIEGYHVRCQSSEDKYYLQWCKLSLPKFEDTVIFNGDYLKWCIALLGHSLQIAQQAEAKPKEKAILEQTVILLLIYMMYTNNIHAYRQHSNSLHIILLQLASPRMLKSLFSMKV